MTPTRRGGGHQPPVPKGSRVTRDPLPLLQLFPDYMARWPLWVAGEGGMVDAEHLGLSEDLTRRIAFWNEHFQQGFHHEHGWKSLEDEHWHRDVGVDLHHRLSGEVDGRYRVEHRAWAVDL